MKLVAPGIVEFEMEGKDRRKVCCAISSIVAVNSMYYGCNVHLSNGEALGLKADYKEVVKFLYPDVETENLETA